MSKSKTCGLDVMLDDAAYQSILRVSRAIAFMYDFYTQKECISPHINELVAGNYNDRLFFSNTA